MANEISRVWGFVVFEANAIAQAELGFATATGLAPSVSLGTAVADPTLLRFRPEQPVSHRLQWRTDIHRTHDGTEYRVALYGAPRQVLDYRYLLVTDAEVREALRTLYGELDSALTMPLWHEAFVLTASASSGTDVLAVSTTYADYFDVGDVVLLISDDDSVYELATVASVATDELTLSDTLTNTWATGSTLFSTVSVLLPDRSSTERAIVNAGIVRAVGTSITRRALGGAGATVDTFNSLPLLDVPPVFTGEAVDAFDQHLETLDYGGIQKRISTSSRQAAPEFGGQRTYRIGGQADLQWWKALLDTIKGRRGAFYWPSYRPDLALATQPTQGASTIDIVDDADYVASRFPIAAMKSIMVATADGDRQPFLVSNAVDNMDGTHTLTLGDTLTNTADGSTVTRIEYMPTARLASDDVELLHYSTYSQLTLGIETEEDPS